ncbi:hypothetical protein GCM10010178_59090 [Lentzea flava]|uniref:Uncharacterized protein n=1 Tax=Lentzea flava TaxID=103732 RepID=A0ABQ2UZ09_9PSEU|nr:hypothetical protein [Lentzea flava]GGU59068.1 hypothetical protein GCM10010178_59090 [Lentzea flava]
MARTLVYGAFPPELRDMWGVRWSRARESEYRAALRSLRAATGVLPERHRMIPYAYEALRRAAA